MSDKWHKPLTVVLTCATGLLGLVLFRWTPTTLKGIAAYVLAAAVLVLLGIMLSSRRRERRLPDKSNDL
jgi:VIT1/CCC1 family predicted Fe2+/Mn2+ transporter